MPHHVLVVLDPDGIPVLLGLPGAPDGHADLELAAGLPLRPAGPELVGDDVVVHRCRAQAAPAADPVGGAVAEEVLAELVQQVVGEETGALPVPAQRPPWYRAGWEVDATAWVDGVLADLGRPRIGPARVVSCWALSQLLVVPTGAGPVWLKGCTPYFPAEPGTTQWLAGRHPGAVPEVLGADRGRGLLLMAPLPDEPATAEDLAAVGARIADLQLASVPLRTDPAVPEVPERGLEITASRFAALVERVVAEGVVPADAVPGVRAAVPEVVRRCAELAGAGLPETLCHGDLHLGNVVRGVGGPVLYDWSDACWSHPLLDVAHLPQVGSGRGAGQDWERAYRERWQVAGWSPEVLVRAAGAAALVERAFQAVTYADLGDALEPAARRGLQDVLPRILGQIADLAGVRGG